MKKITTTPVYRYRYVLRGFKGANKDWTGVFQSKAKALAWYAKHSAFWSARGMEFDLVRCYGDRKDKC